MAMLIDYGIDGNNGAGDVGYIWKMGLILIGCTVITLLFGALAGKTVVKRIYVPGRIFNVVAK